MIHVCFPLHDLYGTYSKYEGAAICSLLENTLSKVTIHLLHDKTLTEENKRNFIDLVSRYQQSIQLYEIDTSNFEDYKAMCGSITIGTLFRLRIPDVLPDTIRKVIYLDADLIFNLDIKELWKVDLSNAMMAGCLDLPVANQVSHMWACETGLIPHESYINAGVLILNLSAIRKEYNLESVCLEFLKKYPKCDACDQDALNYVFQGKIHFLEGKYNLFTRLCDEVKPLIPAIYHYSGVFINYETPGKCDQLFLSYLLKSPWGSGIEMTKIYSTVLEQKRNQIRMYRKFISLMTQRNKKLVIFGVNSVLMKTVSKFVSLHEKQDYCIDNDERVLGRVLHGLEVYHPSRIMEEKPGSFFVIVLSKQHYRELAVQLQGFGLAEGEDFIDGRVLLLQHEGGYIAHHNAT